MNEFKEIKRWPKSEYVGLDAADAPGWDEGWDEAACEECGYAGKDLEQCDNGHPICDDCVALFDGCPSCDPRWGRGWWARSAHAEPEQAGGDQ